MNRKAPGDTKSSDAFDEVQRILKLLNPDRIAMSKHVEETAIRVLGGRTIAKALSDGDVDMVLRYLQTISGGQNG